MRMEPMVMNFTRSFHADNDDHRDDDGQDKCARGQKLKNLKSSAEQSTPSTPTSASSSPLQSRILGSARREDETLGFVSCGASSTTASAARTALWSGSNVDESSHYSSTSSLSSLPSSAATTPNNTCSLQQQQKNGPKTTTFESLATAMNARLPTISTSTTKSCSKKEQKNFRFAAIGDDEQEQDDLLLRQVYRQVRFNNIDNNVNDFNSNSDLNLSQEDRRLRRQIANCNERRRMQSINAGFQALRQHLPQKGGEKMSKAAILQQTADLIYSLKLERERFNNDGHVNMVTKIETDEEDTGTGPKKRRIDDSAMNTEISSTEDKKEAVSDVAEYLKTIEDLKLALCKEQQLRLLYQQEVVELHRKSSNNGVLQLDPNLVSLSVLQAKGEGLLSPRLESTTEKLQALMTSPEKLCSPQVQQVHDQQLLSPQSNSPAVMAVARAAYNNALLAQAQQQQQDFSSLLSPQNHQNNQVRQLNNDLFHSTILQNPMPQAQVQRTFPLSLTNNANQQAFATLQAVAVATSQNNLQDSQQRHLHAILEAIRQLEGNNNTLTCGTPQNMPTDLLVR